MLSDYTPHGPTEKVDGRRMLAYKDGGRVRPVGRKGRDHARRFAGIAAASTTIFGLLAYARGFRLSSSPLTVAYALIAASPEAMLLSLQRRYSSVLGSLCPKVINHGAVKVPPLDTKTS